MKRYIGYSLRWSIAICLIGIAINLKTPVLSKFSPFDAVLVLITSFALLGRSVFLLFKNKPERYQLLNQMVFFLVIAFTIIISVKTEADFYYKKYKVLHTPLHQLQHLGKHFIVGYKDYNEVKRLVSKGAVGGIYITSRNIEGKTLEEIQKDIQGLQKIQESLALPPLLIAADQEGGIVSRMTPPLKKLPPISYITDKNISNIEIEKQITRYGMLQGKELSRLGVNVNFSPVVDLKNKKISAKSNPLTQLNKRAISSDPVLVYRTGLSYCKALENYGVFATLKHFPGLSRVAEDTHFSAGELTDNPDILEINDWLPFKEIAKRTNAFIMIGHVKLSKVDRINLASFSSNVIQGIIRKKWRHDGVLISDDLTMGAIEKSRQGIQGVTIASLNAGIDLLLISYDGNQYYKAMYELIKVDNNHSLDYAILAQSDQRLNMVKERLSKNSFAKNLFLK